MTGLIDRIGPGEALMSNAGQFDVPGAYGLQLQGLGHLSLLSTVDSRRAPTVRLSVEIGRTSGRVESFEDQGAEIALVDDGWISLSRDGRAHFVLPKEMPVEEIVHPWLVPVAATFNGWLGRQVLHGGALSRDGRGVAILGDKEDGKSSLLAWLSGVDELEILSDDLIVIDRGTVFAGPRCIDLRPGSTGVVAKAQRHRLVRGESRLRLTLPPCSPVAQMSAIVVLSWGSDDELALRPLSPSEGIARVLPHALGVGEGGHLLELTSLPIWSLVRPRTWDSMPGVAGLLRRLLD